MLFFSSCCVINPAIHTHMVELYSIQQVAQELKHLVSNSYIIIYTYKSSILVNHIFAFRWNFFRFCRLKIYIYVIYRLSTKFSIFKTHTHTQNILEGSCYSNCILLFLLLLLFLLFYSTLTLFFFSVFKN